MMYQRLTLSTLAPIADPGSLPAELVGLDDVTLADLAAIDPTPAPYGGEGFWPRVRALIVSHFGLMVIGL